MAACGFDPDFTAMCSEEIIDIYDFVPQSVSVFAQLLMEKDNMKAWNEFILQSEEDQQSFLQSVIDDEEDENGIKMDNKMGDKGTSDGRNRNHSDHPAFSPEMSFARIDERIKKIFRKNRRIPMVSSLTPPFRRLLLLLLVTLLLC